MSASADFTRQGPLTLTTTEPGGEPRDRATIRIAAGVPARLVTAAGAARAMNCANVLPATFGAALLLAGGPAFAGDVWSPSDSVLQIVPGKKCLAEILIHNNSSDSADFAEGDLTIGGLTVHMIYRLNVGGIRGADDLYTAQPPAGLIAVPESLMLAEGDTGTILICSNDSVGA